MTDAEVDNTLQNFPERVQIRTSDFDESMIKSVRIGERVFVLRDESPPKPLNAQVDGVPQNDFPTTIQLNASDGKVPGAAKTSSGLDLAFKDALPPKHIQPIQEKDQLLRLDLNDPPNDPTVVLKIGADWKVWLSPNLDLSQIRDMPMEFLLLIRELVSAAIYDKERS